MSPNISGISLNMTCQSSATFYNKTRWKMESPTVAAIAILWPIKLAIHNCRTSAAKSMILFPTSSAEYPYVKWAIQMTHVQKITIIFTVRRLQPVRHYKWYIIGKLLGAEQPHGTFTTQARSWLKKSELFKTYWKVFFIYRKRILKNHLSCSKPTEKCLLFADKNF